MQDWTTTAGVEVRGEMAYAYRRFNDFSTFTEFCNRAISKGWEMDSWQDVSGGRDGFDIRAIFVQPAETVKSKCPET